MSALSGKLSRLRARWREVASSVLYRLGESGWTGRSLVGRIRTGRGRQRARSQTDRNIVYLYVEVFWAGIYMAALAFNATYALRLGASNTLIGWLSSVPSLFAMVVLVPAARFLESRSDRRPWLKWSLAIGRGALLGAAMAPWIFREHVAGMVVAILIVRTIPMHFFSAGFSPMLADVVPVRDRATVLANRSMIMSATVAACTFLFGRWMDVAAGIPWAAFPTNYQLVYIVGAAAGLLSTYFVSRIEPPAAKAMTRDLGVADDSAHGLSETRKPEAATADSPRPSPPEGRRVQAWWRRMTLPAAHVRTALSTRLTRARASTRGLVKENQGFVRIVVNTFVFNCGAWLVAPLYTILFVRQLGATDSWIGLNTTLAHIGVIAGNLIGRRLIDRWGADRTLRTVIPLSASYALLVALFPDLTLILLFGVLINLVNPGVNLSHASTLYELVPVERRPSYLAVYATIANVGAFIMPLVGTALSNHLDIRWILVIGGLVRLGGASLFHIFKVRPAGAPAA